ncbi:MAG TPA: 2-amino-4-hydroxy-6-hydroxymethyldihydropteridine diphosphokinase [Terriglobales bacterium]|nr:2-amino-4-hydroxy-6-hydroxymethyldihydropteridine diphosphokinase [Terriglobales bacterium]
MTHRVYLSLGSNLGNRAANLQKCIRLLGKLGDIAKVSSFYETEPMELREQPWFVNSVVKLETQLSARELLSRIQQIEAQLGRSREINKGPRTIDIDILLFDSEVIKDSDLQIPHPTMHKRRFVLAPLTEISARVKHPVLGATAEELLQRLDSSGGEVRRLAPK